MLKYKYVKEVFAEVPEEISLGISISGCQIHCYGCHSRDLWENTGTDLTKEELDNLIKKHNGISCILFLGGEHNIEYLKELCKYVKSNTMLKTAWYCGLDIIPKEHIDILCDLDYIKTGHFDMELGGLDSPNTNQRLYIVKHSIDGSCCQEDITYKFLK